MFEKIEQDAVLGYDLPRKPGMLAGQIVKHCFETVGKVLSLKKPCIFKVGVTHCAYFRWHNHTFGYRYEIERWEKMVVLYVTHEALSPAFVEGALIQHHKGSLNACYML